MDRVIVITGGAKGIGRCMVERFAKKGDRVYFIDIDDVAITALCDEMREAGYSVFGFYGDMSEEIALDAVAAYVLEREDGIHCLINNACLMLGGVLENCNYEDFMYVQRVGVTAPFWLSRLFKNHFIGMGSIVNIASSRAFQSQPNTESSTAAKGGIIALTHALALSIGIVVRFHS